MDGGPGNNINYHQYYPRYCFVFPAQHIHSTMQANHPLPSTANLGHYPPHNNPIYFKDERAQRQYFKLEKKLHDKQMLKNESTSLIREELSNNLRQADMKTVEDMNSLGTSDDGEESSIAEDENIQIITEILSAVQPPKVSELSSRSALLQWAPPSAQLSELEDIDDINISENDLRYEVLLSDKVKEMKFKSIYNGPHLSCRIQDLKPCHEYYVCLQVHLDEMQGSATDPVIFITPPCEPDQPRPPKLFHQNKNSLHLRWNAPNDNGSHILYYVLEYDGETDNFVEFYRGKGKNFTLNKLKSATLYRFRMAAYNEIGRSPYSEIVGYRTLDNPPTQPYPPDLVKRTVNALHLTWKQGTKGEEFILQMNNLENKYGFMNVYHGRENYYECRGLNRFSDYTFRLRAKNDDGFSNWSNEVTFRTLPDKPARPSKPVVKGRIHADSFKLRWEPPNDTGGTEINGYILEMNSGSGYETVYSGKETEALCDKLTPGTTYQLRVSCFSSDGGHSNYSDPCTVTTEAIVPTQCPSPELLGTPKADSISIGWTASDYNGGAPVLEYEVEVLNHESSPVLVKKTTDTKCIINNLLPGSIYTFRVRAVNRIGPSDWSEPLRVTSGAAEPLVPETPVLYCKSPYHVTVDWKEPVSNGAPITEYRLEMSLDEKEHFTCVYQGPNRTHEVKSLSPCQKYYFKVQAANHVGFSQFSSVASIVTPAAPPSVINTLKHISSPTSITLYWSTPVCNGSSITHYNIEIGETSVSTEIPVNEWLVDNLQPETNYKIRIQAVNSISNGPWSSFQKITTLRLPPKPPKIECNGIGHNYLKLKWGDKKNIDYIQYCVEMASPRSQDFQCVYKGSALCCKVNKLQELTSYRFRINATSDAGTGKFSEEYVLKTSISPPASVKMPKIVELESSNCTLEWFPSKNHFSDSVVYQIHLMKHKDQPPVKVSRSSETKYNIEDLEPATDYSLKVAPVRLAATGELYGPFSPILNFSTPPLHSSEIVQPSVISTNSTGNSQIKYQLHWDNIQIPSVNWTYIYVFMVMLLGIIISLGIETFL